MGKKADRRESETFRAKVRELLAAGRTPAQIAKDTGKSYTHTKRIVEQEKSDGRV